MKKPLLIGLGVVAIGLAPFFVSADTGIKNQLAQIQQQALLLREQVRALAFENPVKASSASGKRWQVALQVGHWKLEGIPWELQRLYQSRQARGGGKIEWEVNLEIAQKTAALLEKEGIGVTLLPAVLPGVYKADVFVAIHADQNPLLPYASGFKAAASAYDQSGKAKQLAQLLNKEYRTATWLNQERYIPATMPYYYAFNWKKFLYAVHPTTPAAIIETGYLSNPRDRAILVTNPAMAAQGIAQAILKFLKENS
ncbi:MAG: N-acetylmuramoyl-L-alanine amidase [Candidatus Wildermuthbacteria bacterium]|nr:N-acetylmuramoyl-L-alanine amidase [Candidatus Wildermuthbacteria bacterium]